MHPPQTVGSAGAVLFDPDAYRSHEIRIQEVGEHGRAHPRGAGTFSRVLGQYVREKGALGLMEALGKMSYLPAKRLENVVPQMQRKGRIEVGADADLAVWDPGKKLRITKDLVHDQTGYTPYDGRELTGWPVTVISRGDVIVEDGKLNAARGRGQFLARGRSAALEPLGRQVPEMAQLAAWNTPLKL